MQSAIVKMLLGMLTKAGLKTLFNQIAKSEMFQEFIQGLILKRVEGLKDTHPETYTSIEGYTIAVSKLPAIFTDDNPNNLEQVAAAFRLKQFEALEATFEDIQDRAAKVLINTKRGKLKLTLSQ